MSLLRFLGLADKANERDARETETVHRIASQLDRLEPDYRIAIELRYLLGLSGEEAAAVMNRSHGAFRALLHRATAAFKREYGGPQ